MQNYLQNKFIMLAGLPGAGKSYFANKMMAESSLEMVWLSSDKIREEMYGSEDVQGDSSKVFEEMRRRTEQALKEGKNVIYDACNINSKRRIALLKVLKRFSCEKICVICATPYEECLKRNSLRERVVPEDVIKRMYMTWNTPYYFEGWDDIKIEYAENAKGFYGSAEEFVEKLMDYQQDTPYHTETLGTHMKGASQYLIEKGGYAQESNMAIAALIHDCGKPFTKVFHNAKGEETEIAHYYQHQCNGAYDAFFFELPGKDNNDMLEISVLINLHMHPFGWNDEKKGAKQESIWGEKLYRDICKLHEADEAASFRAENY